RALVRGVGVWNIDIELRLRRLAMLAGVRHHHAGVADLEFRMHDQTVGPLMRLENGFGSERLLEELDHLSRAPNGQVRRDRMKAIRNGFYRHVSTPSNLCLGRKRPYRRISPFIGRSREHGLAISRSKCAAAIFRY